MKAALFFLALLLSWEVIVRFINSMALIIRTGQPRADNSVSFIFELLVCLLWTIFYLLKDY